MIHEFFFFLGTLDGIFLKTSLELVLFVFVTYMILSEYLKDRRRELRYLIIAFSGLSLHRLIMAFLFAKILFGKFSLMALEPYLPLLNALELLALVLLANAFIFPLFEKRVEKLVKYIKIEMISLFIVLGVIELLWLIDIRLTSDAMFRFHWGTLVFIILRIIILSYPLYFLIPRLKAERAYYRNIMIAFLAYLVVPILQFINFVFFNSTNAKLAVVEHPFPLISVFLFSRVIYLKLVDKAFLRDQLKISEQKYKEEKEISKMKDEFISVVSHELRTPLTSMKLYTNLLKKGQFGKIEKSQEKALSVIEDETNRLGYLIDDILNLSKLESKKAKLRLGKVDFTELSKNRMYYSMAKQKNIKVVNKVPKNFVIKVDPDKFRQIFVNLLSNAVKYTGKNGTIRVGAKEDEDNWHVSISDTGRGIEKSEIPKLFNKFYQVEGHMTRSEGGTGLGLAIVKHLVDLHKGDITVESEVGRGSTFTVCFPKK